MMIWYDFELKDHPNVRRLNDTTEKILSDVRVFVIERFKPLATEMAREENLYGAFAVIYLLDPETWGEIHYIDYSEQLTEKLQNSLTPDDIRYLHLNILNTLPELGN